MRHVVQSIVASTIVRHATRKGGEVQNQYKAGGAGVCDRREQQHQSRNEWPDSRDEQAAAAVTPGDANCRAFESQGDDPEEQ